ncbi:MAG: membrane integrity-associated transporter subunit PqiC [Hyphomicrobiales bacterium]|nr:membrane integrity-associated transporter subunit PqiC [Hyphomicrobiales bacterium]
METNARYVIVGLFATIVAAAGFVFVYWLHTTGGFTANQAIYRVRFDTPVMGLRPGVPVLFNGLRVGEVRTATLDPGNPKSVLASLAVDPATPIRADTHVGVDSSGLMGSINVSLTGGSSDAVLQPAPDGRPPILVADPGASQSLGQAAQQAVNQLNAILGDNASPLHNAIVSFGSFSDALGRNSGRIDNIMAGLEKMTGGGPQPPAPIFYDLNAPAFPPAPKPLTAQIAVAETTAPVVFQTQRALVSPRPGERRPLESGQWSDNLPVLVRAKIVQTLENAGFTRVAGAQDGLSPDVQLLIDIRSFEVTLDPRPSAHVNVAAKLLGADGKIMGGKDFDGSTPAEGADPAAVFAALDEAFGKVAYDLGVWIGTTVKAQS